ncbi:MAG: hypothetical protein QI223_08125 [Candidatus Korarchaeota archaeon]|nr:hypothetical protein [Candidatus Korarchaeota archaeon]
MPESDGRLPYVEEAKTEILRILGEVEVAYDRELRYRLEGRFAHDISWRALSELTPRAPTRT